MNQLLQDNLYLVAIAGVIIFALIIGLMLRRKSGNHMPYRPSRQLYTSHYDSPLPTTTDDVPVTEPLLLQERVDIQIETDPVDPPPAVAAADDEPLLSTSVPPDVDDHITVQPDDIAEADSALQVSRDNEEDVIEPIRENTERLQQLAQTETELEPEVIATEEEQQPEELIVVLYVISASEETGFSGRDIFSAMEELGLNYGRMHIFHHYGVGELKARQALFSAASMVEPGTFNPHEMDTFTTPGLVLFMRLPGPFGGRVAFELMLNSAQRLADLLGGRMKDQSHSALSQQAVDDIRKRIALFEGR